MSKENLTESGFEPLAPQPEQRLLTIWGTANIGLDSSVGKNAGTSNQRSRVQTPIKSNFLCPSEIEYRKTQLK